MTDIYLASKSPRRFELLQQLALSPKVIEVDVDEGVGVEERVEEYVLRVSVDKAVAGWRELATIRTDLPLLAADTAVVVDSEILGKPRDFTDAKRMWRLLSGREHQVVTAVVVQQGEKRDSCCQTSQVRMREIDEAEMRAYWQSGEPADKAGGYGIQGLGACFIEHINGSYSGIMGLPLFETAQILKGFGVRVLA